MGGYSTSRSSSKAWVGAVNPPRLRPRPIWAHLNRAAYRHWSSIAHKAEAATGGGNAMKTAVLTAMLAAVAVQVHAQDTALTQQEFVPKSGTGRVVVMVSGQTGPGGYMQSAQELADAGFDVVL